MSWVFALKIHCDDCMAADYVTGTSKDIEEYGIYDVFFGENHLDYDDEDTYTHDLYVAGIAYYYERK